MIVNKEQGTSMYKLFYLLKILGAMDDELSFYMTRKFDLPDNLYSVGFV